MMKIFLVEYKYFPSATECSVYRAYSRDSLDAMLKADDPGHTTITSIMEIDLTNEGEVYSGYSCC